MPSYQNLSGVVLGKLPKAITRAQRDSLTALDDWDQGHTLDSYKRVLEAASRPFAGVTLEATVEEDSGATYLLRARGGKAALTHLGTAPPPPPRAFVPDSLKLGFPQSIATAIDDRRARGGATNDLLRLVWDRFEKDKKKISAADVERVLARYATEKQKAKRYFLETELCTRMKREAAARGTKVSPLLLYACATYGLRLLKRSRS